MENPATFHEVFLTGLRNDHAMENQALAIMKPQLDRLENCPEMSKILDRHLRENEDHMQRIESILQSMDESSSGLKDTVLSMAGSKAALTHSIAPHEILKNPMGNFAFEHFEIAAYTSLITAARLCGASSAMNFLEQNLAEERQMAKGLEQMLPMVTERYITFKASDQKAGV